MSEFARGAYVLTAIPTAYLAGAYFVIGYEWLPFYRATPLIALAYCSIFVVAMRVLQRTITDFFVYLPASKFEAINRISWVIVWAASLYWALSLFGFIGLCFVIAACCSIVILAPGAPPNSYGFWVWAADFSDKIIRDRKTVLGLLVCAYMIGYGFAEQQLFHSKKFFVEHPGDSFEVSLLSRDASGVLIYERRMEMIKFVPWDKITRISAVKHDGCKTASWYSLWCYDYFLHKALVRR